MSDVDDLALPDDCDPSRWPFCEARARAAAAWSAFPEPPKITARRRTSGVSQVARAEARRARQRAEEARTA